MFNSPIVLLEGGGMPWNILLPVFIIGVLLGVFSARKNDEPNY